MMTEKQLRASEDAARAAPADKDGIWVNVSEDGHVMGNVYSSKEWAEHYGDPHGVKSVRYVPESRVTDELAASRARVADLEAMLREAIGGPRQTGLYNLGRDVGSAPKFAGAPVEHAQGIIDRARDLLGAPVSGGSTNLRTRRGT